jgi:hypothetical protein
MLARSLTVCSVAVLALGPLAPTAPAQDSSVTYSAGALRFKPRFAGAQVVAGVTETVVSRPAFGGVRVGILENATDSVRWHYRAYRRNSSGEAILGMISGAAGIAGLIFIGSHASQHPTANVVLVSTSIVSGFLASLVGSRGADHLQRAIWLYNARFAPAVGPPN